MVPTFSIGRVDALREQVIEGWVYFLSWDWYSSKLKHWDSGTDERGLLHFAAWERCGTNFQHWESGRSAGTGNRGMGLLSFMGLV